MRKRIYVAGPLAPKGVHPATKHPTIEYLYNVRAMIAGAVELINRGYSPFCPGIDFSYFIYSGANISESKIKGVSMDWLRVSDGLLLLPRWKKSAGTLAEIAEATSIGIPMFESIDELDAHFRNGGKI